MKTEETEHKDPSSHRFKILKLWEFWWKSTRKTECLKDTAHEVTLVRWSPKPEKLTGKKRLVSYKCVIWQVLLLLKWQSHLIVLLCPFLRTSWVITRVFVRHGSSLRFRCWTPSVDAISLRAFTRKDKQIREKIML